MAHRNIHFYGRGACRYGSDELVQGTFSVKELKELYALKANNNEAFDEALEEVEDYFTVSGLMEDLTEEDFLKVVNGDTGFVQCEEIWFGIGGTITKAKIGFAEGEFHG
jgi:hypothetical protein